ncbi:phenylalanyl-tRNA synthetase [Meira miltonrushii]|uniref:Phenylalanine--tRNA ligase, mitochondrial n=1 Tax=Meira miltonrushii TaxID=1280837 RepID=A0A316V695_9BASI|nr:phenylalanyl-tRNA synthetase [Meira miltonrushii]PWN31733.1 phenylalanyl-tRNA synthetase [Meira miltonrushii]
MCLSRTFHSISLSSTQPTRKYYQASYTTHRNLSNSTARSQQSIKVLDKEHAIDDYTNIPTSINSRLQPEPRLPQTVSHPINLLCNQIHRSMPEFEVIKPPSPVVTVEDNFGSLGFPEDHPGRSPTDTYYINRSTCLRTHTSTHEVDTFSKGHTKWLLTADVFRRDEIDASHYPIFHQMEGACVYDLSEYEEGGRVKRECEEMEQRLKTSQIEIEDNVDIQEAGGYQPAHEQDPKKKVAAQLAMRHLKASLNNLVLDLFSERHAADVASEVAAGSTAEPLRVRWISASFPFTSPSFEIEVMFRGKWLEILGCGVVMERTLENAKVTNKLGWAFGLGLERIAMVLFQIPDIRLFWSQDPRFLSQFASPKSSNDKKEHESKTGVSSAGGASVPDKTTSPSKLPLITFKPYSRYPPCYKDVSFWLPTKSSTSNTPALHENDVFEVIRDIAGDLTEDVVLIDDFVHPKTQKQSKCFRINYRSMDRNLENEEVNQIHAKVTQRLVDDLKVELR